MAKILPPSEPGSDDLNLAKALSGLSEPVPVDTTSESFLSGAVSDTSDSVSKSISLFDTPREHRSLSGCVELDPRVDRFLEVYKVAHMGPANPVPRYEDYVHGLDMFRRHLIDKGIHVSRPFFEKSTETDSQIEAVVNNLGEILIRQFQAGITTWYTQIDLESSDPDKSWLKVAQQLLMDYLPLDHYQTDGSINLNEERYFMEQQRVPTAFQNLCLAVFEQAQQLYLGSERQRGLANTDPEVKDLTTNHFLRVSRFATGMVYEAVRQKLKNGSRISPSVQRIGDLADQETLLKMRLTAYFHDAVEDGKIQPESFKILLGTLFDEFVPKEMYGDDYALKREAIINDVVVAVEGLNSKPFRDPDTGFLDTDEFLKHFVGLPFFAQIVKQCDVIDNQMTYPSLKDKGKNALYISLLIDMMERGVLSLLSQVHLEHLLVSGYCSVRNQVPFWNDKLGCPLLGRIKQKEEQKPLEEQRELETIFERWFAKLSRVEGNLEAKQALAYLQTQFSPKS